MCVFLRNVQRHDTVQLNDGRIQNAHGAQSKKRMRSGSVLPSAHNRLLADTNVYVRNTGDRIILNKDKPIGLCRPRLMVDGHLIQPNNDTDAQTVKNLTKELTTDQIKHLEVVDRETANALFGSSGWCGIVLLTPTNRKARKSLLRYKI